MTLPIRALAPGSAEGLALVLDQPLSLWGGLDPATGRIVDRRHPQWDALVTGRVLVMASGRGSSSSSSVLAEAVRLGFGPAAIVLREPDAILVIGSLVALELYGHAPPVVVVGPDVFATIRTGDAIRVSPGGISLAGGAGET